MSDFPSRSDPVQAKIFIDELLFSLAESRGSAGQHLPLDGQPPVGRGQPVPEVVVGRQLDRLK